MTAVPAAPAWVVLRSVGATMLALAGLYFPKIALGAAFLVLIAFLALPKDLPHRARRWLLGVLGVGALAGALGGVRFVVTEAVPGIVQGGEAATATSTVSRLREVLWAEDSARRLALIDPDGDRIGSAALLGELTGQLGLRGGKALDPPILNQRFTDRVETKIGPAAAGLGYLFVVCLPKRGGGFTAHPDEPIDEELAERRYLAYAWPAATGRHVSRVFALDERERIWVNDNRDQGELRWAGPFFPPPCDAVLAPTTSAGFSVWKNKQPRTTLPGDPSSAGAQ